MAAHDPSERAQIASIAAHDRWSREPDRRAATEAARRGLADRFERLVDPDGTLDTVTRARLADNARQAHMKRMALKSAQARRKIAEGRRALLDAEAGLAG